MSANLQSLIASLPDDPDVVFLTGAGISAESGIPTFRGPEGYWTVGSRVYQPQEMATQANFQRMPREVWGWYLFRLGVCRAAEPNAAHRALAELEAAAPERFHLITQNVDGLHLRAGNTRENTYEIHGNIDDMRCARWCCEERWPMPLPLPRDSAEISDEDYARLTCPRCGAPARPHVLWFETSRRAGVAWSVSPSDSRTG